MKRSVCYYTMVRLFLTRELTDARLTASLRRLVMGHYCIDDSTS